MAFGDQTKTGGLSNSPIYGWWRPAWNLSFEGRVRNVAVWPPSPSTPAIRPPDAREIKELVSVHAAQRIGHILLVHKVR